MTAVVYNRFHDRKSICDVMDVITEEYSLDQLIDH